MIFRFGMEEKEAGDMREVDVQSMWQWTNHGPGLSVYNQGGR